MSLRSNNFQNKLPLGCTKDLDLVGLDTFKKKLEKNYFAEVEVRKCISDSQEIELVIEVRSRISLALAVEHFRVDVLSKSNTADSNILLYCLSKLRAANNRESIDIMEISFLMEDTSIFIQRVCDFSIVQQLDNIFRLVMNNYNYIIAEIKEVPSEIHIPVFKNDENEKNKLNMFPEKARETTEKEYFAYWGLYLDALNETAIYDVEKSRFIFEEISYFQ